MKTSNILTKLWKHCSRSLQLFGASFLWLPIVICTIAFVLAAKYGQPDNWTKESIIAGAGVVISGLAFWAMWITLKKQQEQMEHQRTQAALDNISRSFDQTLACLDSLADEWEVVKSTDHPSLIVLVHEYVERFGFSYECDGSFVQENFCYFQNKLPRPIKGERVKLKGKEVISYAHEYIEYYILLVSQIVDRYRNGDAELNDFTSAEYARLYEATTQLINIFSVLNSLFTKLVYAVEDILSTCDSEQCVFTSQYALDRHVKGLLCAIGTKTCQLMSLCCEVKCQKDYFLTERCMEVLVDGLLLSKEMFLNNIKEPVRSAFLHIIRHRAEPNPHEYLMVALKDAVNHQVSNAKTECRFNTAHQASPQSSPAAGSAARKSAEPCGG